MPTLPLEWMNHLRTGVSHRIGSVNAAGRPAIGRGLAADCDAQGQVLALTLRSAAGAVLDAIAETGWVSLVMAQPQSNRTLHLKGRDARVEPVGTEYDALIRTRGEAFAAQIEPYGFAPEQVLLAHYSTRPGDVFAVRFTILGAWDQTPGPGAGGMVALAP